MERDIEKMELEQMREQLVMLREKLRLQEIVSEKTIIKSIRQGVRSINRRGIAYIIFGLLAIPFCCWNFAFMGYSEGFVWGTGIMLAVCLGVTIYAHFGLHTLDMSGNDLVQVALRTIRLRNIYKKWYYFSIPMVMIWGYFLYREITDVVSDEQTLYIILISAVVGVLIGGIIGIRMHNKVIREADEVLEHIRDMKDMK